MQTNIGGLSSGGSYHGSHHERKQPAVSDPGIKGANVLKALLKDSSSSKSNRNQDDAETRALKRAAKKDAKVQLELLCADYNTAMEEAKVGMKGSRKVTYLLKHGTIEYPECFVKEKKSVILLPHNYTVAFEAHCKVWVARIIYTVREDGTQGANYEVIPVSKMGKEQHELSSKPKGNISLAFKCALQNSAEAAGGQITKTIYRPNGRLYIGVFYDSMQDRLRDIFHQKLVDGSLGQLKPVLMRKLDEWLMGAEGDEASQPRFNRAPADYGMEGVSYRNPNPQFVNGINRNPRPVFGSDMTRTFDTNLPMFDTFQQSAYSTPHGNNPVAASVAAPKISVPNFMPTRNARDFLKPLMDPAPIATGNGLQQFALPMRGLSTLSTASATTPAPQISASMLHTNHERQEKSRTISRTRSDSVTGRRKRNMIATNARALAKAVSEPDNMYEELEAVFKKVLAKIGDSDEATRGGDDVTVRLISKLDQLKKMIVQTTQMKRRRTISEESTTKPTSMSPQNGSSNGYPASSIKKSTISVLKQADSSSSLGSLMDSIDNVGGSSSAGTPRSGAGTNAPLLPRGMYQAGSDYYSRNQQNSTTRSLNTGFQNSPSRRSDSRNSNTVATKDDDSKSVKSGFDFNDAVFQNAVKAANDISNFDFDELMDGQSGTPVVVGCNLTHEGLYLTLDVNRSNNIGEKELKKALKCLRIPVTSSIVKKTLEACDKNGDGKISMEEFLEYLREREKELKKMFNEMDISGDGYVTLEELKQARTQGVFEASDGELKQLIDWMDNQEYGWRDGRIEFEEFRTSMILLPPATSIQEIIECFRNKS